MTAVSSQGSPGNSPLLISGCPSFSVLPVGLGPWPCLWHFNQGIESPIPSLSRGLLGGGAPGTVGMINNCPLPCQAPLPIDADTASAARLLASPLRGRRTYPVLFGSLYLPAACPFCPFSLACFTYPAPMPTCQVSHGNSVKTGVPIGLGQVRPLVPATVSLQWASLACAEQQL